MKKEVRVDVVIVGGGIAGLWLLTRVRQAGFSAILFESGSLGGGQTHKSQGIIHGGLKYALQGALTKEARAMADMPARWKACLAGTADINLSDVRTLSLVQHLWAPNKLTAKIAGFFASKSLAGMVSTLPTSDFPPLFQHDAFKGNVYVLNEMVLDVPSLVLSLVKRNQDVIFKIEPLSVEGLYLHDETLQAMTVYQHGKALTVQAKHYIFAAGSGNEVIVNKWRDPSVNMQRRPLHMVWLKMPSLPILYGHCLGFGQRPRVTITTHYTRQGEPVWYMGGLVAEEGVALTEEQQVLAAKKELTLLFPWLDFSRAEWGTIRIDRAEAKHASGLMPDGAYLKVLGNQLLVWPTKLALTPQLADQVLAHLTEGRLTPTWCDLRELRSSPMPTLAKPVWEGT